MWTLLAVQVLRAAHINPIGTPVADSVLAPLAGLSVANIEDRSQGELQDATGVNDLKLKD